MINWKEIKHFKKHEFSEDPDIYAEPELILNLERYRILLNNKVHPSPREGTLARFEDEDKYSQHYAMGRKSTATDVFPDGDPLIAWMLAISCGLWGGVGVYFDTTYLYKPKIMLHLDLGRNRLWYRVNGVYCNPLLNTSSARKLMQLFLIQ